MVAKGRMKMTHDARKEEYERAFQEVSRVGKALGLTDADVEAVLEVPRLMEKVRPMRPASVKQAGEGLRALLARLSLAKAKERGE